MNMKILDFENALFHQMSSLEIPKYTCIYTWNPNDPCFDWKRPCFEGFHHQNRGQTGSRYIYTRVKVGGTLTMHCFIMFIFPPCKKTYLLGMVGRLAMYFDHRGYRIKACGSTSHPASEKWRVCSIENPRTKKSWNVTLTEYRDSYRQRWSIPRYTSIRIWF